MVQVNERDFSKRDILCVSLILLKLPTCIGPRVTSSVDIRSVDSLLYKRAYVRAVRREEPIVNAKRDLRKARSFIILSRCMEFVRASVHHCRIDMY